MSGLLSSEKFAARFETFIAILLGITAVLTAYASWQSSLYDGNQSSCYAAGTALIADANSLYNEADQLLVQDMDVWNRIVDLRIEAEYAAQYGNTDDVERNEWKLNLVMADNVTETFSEAIDWADAQPEYASPFDMEGYVETYFVDADATYDEGQAKIEEGERNNDLGDRLGLVTVIFAVILFLLGIVNTFKSLKTKSIIIGASILALIFAVVRMAAVPMIMIW